MYYTSHNRNKLNFTWDGIKASQISLNRLRDAYKAHAMSDIELTLEEKQNIDVLVSKFNDGINDDLNFAKALSAVWEIAKFSVKSKDIAKILLQLDEVLVLDISKENENMDITYENNVTLPNEIEELVKKRYLARSIKDFKLSDEIRDELLNLGYKVVDSKEGQNIINIATQEEVFYANDRLK